MIRLFNDNGCETPTAEGQLWGETIGNALEPLIRAALDNNVSLRDLQTLVTEEIAVRCAEERLRRGLVERREQRKAWSATHPIKYGKSPK